MVYNEKLVAVIKCNGRVLREETDVVTLSFNSEYSILIKNLDSRKAVVKVSIDGQDVLSGNSLVIEPNREIELEGFMNGSIAKNRFKFIQKTKEISDFRGDRVDDGIIRIEYWFEKYVEKIKVIQEYNYWPTYRPIVWIDPIPSRRFNDVYYGSVVEWVFQERKGTRN